jgi:hypothetical protein
LAGNNLSESKSPLLIRNPKSGSSVQVNAGGSIQIELNFKSDVPETASYYADVVGLASPEWASGTGETSRISVSASGTVNLLIALNPPVDASPGEYAIRVMALCEGDPVNGEGLPLVLVVAPGPALEVPIIETDTRVEPAPELAPAPAPSPYRKRAGAQPAPPAPVEDQTTLKAPLPKPRKEPTPPSVAAAAPAAAPNVIEMPDTDAIEPSEQQAAETLAAPAPSFEAAPIIAPPVQPAVAAPIETKIEQPSRTVAEPIKPIEQKREAPVRNVAEPIRPITPKLEKAPPREAEIESIVMDLEQETVDRAKPETAEGEDAKPDENYLDDPIEGGVVTLRPGESILLRFGFINNEKRRITYILEEDRSNPDECLPPDWTTLVRGQVNVGENDRRYLAIRVKPPVTAEPGEKRFVVLLGPDTDYLTPRTLILSVKAAPAVKVTSVQQKVSTGPFSRHIDFKLKVESAGNSQTAFRVAVKNPETVDPTAPEGSESAPDEDIYESTPWQYLFDQEVANLKSPSSNKPPDPEQIKLRVKRHGTWWFGFLESHKLKVGAVPVTDNTNGGKTENTIDLTAVRWRLWPLPYWTIIPALIILLIIASGKPTELQVINAVPGSDAETFVLGTPASPGKVTVNLQWKGPGFPWINLAETSQNAGFSTSAFLKNDKYSDPVTINSTTYGTERTYTVGNSSTVHVEVLPAATTGDLSLQWRLPGKQNQNLALTSSASTTGQTTVSANIPLPADRKEFVLRAVNSSSNQHIQVYVLHESDGVTVTDAQTADNNAATKYMDVHENDNDEITIELSGSNPAGQNELDLVSSDANNQIIQLHF